MTEKKNFALIGDHRDIPMLLGLCAITWNSCEGTLRQILRDLGSGGDVMRYKLVEILVSELGSAGIAQALNCYADEFPSENADIANAIRHATLCLERARSYRNYYVHAIGGVTQYGLFMTDELIEKNAELHKAMAVGPFGSIYAKTAKGKSKFWLDYISTDQLASFSNFLVDYHKYLGLLELTIRHYFRRFPYPETAPPPQALSLLDMLEKPVLNHPKLRRQRSLDLDKLDLPFPEDDEVPSDEEG